ncbi:DUF2079 domain-containing protein [Streptomyces spiramyceticus]|uniref:DUF2079 domain-containing protein n=1 Tax=Streptomyces spiramyceticus TaxID=299717 RepID=UPI00237A8524|nr:DUF2079 domain-containing protein [Streptomyces spiramyceticus]
MRTKLNVGVALDPRSLLVHRPGRRRPPGPLPLQWGWAGALFLLYVTLSARRHALLRSTGYDLGIFEQAVRAYSELRAPVAPLKGEGFNLLGDHFHPVLAVLGPFYRLWPSPYCLLTAQAALLALGVVPLARWASRALGRPAAHAVAFAYGASWGIASAVAFDFHEAAFAVPLLAFAVTAAGNRRWRSAAAWGLPLLLVKEDLGLTLAALGAYIALKGPVRLGIATVGAGVLGTLLATKVLVPAFSSAGAYAYGQYVAGSRSSLLATLALAPLDALRPDTKPITLVLVFAVTAFVALRSPLALIAVPTLGWRMLSQHDYHWGTAFHYSVVLMPIVFAALIDALTPYARTAHPLARRHLRASLAASVAVTLVLLPSFPFALLAQRATWSTSRHVETARDLLRRIPDGATVAASNRLAPQLTSRCTVVLFPSYPIPGKLYEASGRPPPPTADWIIHDRTPAESWPLPKGHWPYPPDRQQAELAAAQRKYDYELVAARDGLTLLRHRRLP